MVCKGTRRPCFPVSFSRFESSQCAVYTCDSSTTICASPQFSSRSSGHAIIPVLTPGFETSGHAMENNRLSPTISLNCLRIVYSSSLKSLKVKHGNYNWTGSYFEETSYCMATVLYWNYRKLGTARDNFYWLQETRYYLKTKEEYQVCHVASRYR